MKPDGTEKGDEQHPGKSPHAPKNDPDEYARELAREHRRMRQRYCLKSAALVLLPAFPIGLLMGWLMRRFELMARYGRPVLLVIGACGVAFMLFGFYKVFREKR